MWARINRKFCLRLRLPRQFMDLLHAANLRHGTNGFTSLPKEGVLRNFSTWKILTASAGFEPANLSTWRQHATAKPPKLLPCALRGGSHFGTALGYGLLLCQRWCWRRSSSGSDAVTLGEKLQAVRRIVAPSSLGTSYLFVDRLTFLMKTSRFFETSGITYLNIRRTMPNDRSLWSNHSFLRCVIRVVLGQ